jgi:hypothetical protein
MPNFLEDALDSPLRPLDFKGDFRYLVAFDAQGDQLNRHFGHFRIEKGKQVLVQIIKGPEG